MKWVIGVVIYLSLVGIRYSNSLQVKQNLDKYVDKEIQLVANISSEPLLQGGKLRFKIGRIDVYTAQYPKYEYGDKVMVFGNLQRWVTKSNQPRFSLMYPEIVIVESEGDKNIGYELRQRIIKLRQEVVSIYNQHLPEPEASLLAGIVLGMKRSLPQEFWLALQKTGTLHIVVASGYNVMVVMATIILVLAGFLGRKVAIGAGFLAVFIYTIMAGAEPAIIRAAIMGSLAYFAQFIGKEADGVRALGLAGAVMILIKPEIIWDIGFQLSFMASLGLILLAGRWQKKLWRLKQWGQDLATTLAAFVFVWPIIAINFEQMSAFGILINSLILWLVPIIMGLGGLLGLLGWVPGLGQVIGWLAYVPLWLMVSMIEIFAKIPWVSWQVVGLSWWWGAGYYLVLGWFILKTRRQSEDKLETS